MNALFPRMQLHPRECGVQVLIANEPEKYIRGLYALTCDGGAVMAVVDDARLQFHSEAVYG